MTDFPRIPLITQMGLIALQVSLIRETHQSLTFLSRLPVRVYSTLALSRQLFLPHEALHSLH